MPDSLAGPTDTSGQPTPGRRPGGQATTLLTDASTRSRLARQARRDTAAEALRRELHRRGLRYRVEYPIPAMPRRRADVAFPSPKVAVMVDGCFWHSCPVHGTSPRNNAAWWAAKLLRNAERDLETDRHLESMGWTVVRVWEHEAPSLAADTVADAVTAAKLRAISRRAVRP